MDNPFFSHVPLLTMGLLRMGLVWGDTDFYESYSVFFCTSNQSSLSTENTPQKSILLVLMNKVTGYLRFLINFFLSIFSFCSLHASRQLAFPHCLGERSRECQQKTEVACEFSDSVSLRNSTGIEDLQNIERQKVFPHTRKDSSKLGEGNGTKT